MSLSREEIMSAGAEFKLQEIEVPALGGSVFVREVNAKELDKIQLLLRNVGAGSTRPFSAEICAYLICDSDGKRLFNDSQIEKLNSINGKVLEPIMTAGLKLNGLGDDDPVERESKN